MRNAHHKIPAQREARTRCAPPEAEHPRLDPALERDWTAAARAYWSARHDPVAFAAMRRAAERCSAATHTQFDAVYWDIWQWREVGDPSDLDTPVAFLEADPWWHGSGYMKETVIRRTTQRPIPEHYAERLRRVVLAMVDRRHTREFRVYCRLARHVDSAALRRELGARLADDDPHVRLRARWMLQALGELLGPSPFGTDRPPNYRA